MPAITSDTFAMHITTTTTTPRNKPGPILPKAKTEAERSHNYMVVAPLTPSAASSASPKSSLSRASTSSLSPEISVPRPTFVLSKQTVQVANTSNSSNDKNANKNHSSDEQDKNADVLLDQAVHQPKVVDKSVYPFICIAKPSY